MIYVEVIIYLMTLRYLVFNPLFYSIDLYFMGWIF